MNNEPHAVFPCDLHSHTVRSDGKDTVVELIDNAAAHGLRVLALSDHDITPPTHIDVGGQLISPCEYALSKGLYLIPGIEISCETNIDDTHIVCIGCDWKDPFFDQIERFTVNSKINAYKELVRRIREDGFDITWSKVLNRHGQTFSPEQVQKKMIFEALEEVGFAPSWAEAKKMVNSNPRYHINREKPDAVSTITEVHRTGGYAILAHPFLIPDVVSHNGEEKSRAEFIETLLKAGLDGIETRYPYHKTSYTGTKTAQEISDIVQRTYAGRVRLLSAGSDYHAEYRTGTPQPRHLGECGLSLDEVSQNRLLCSVLTALYGSWQL